MMKSYGQVIIQMKLFGRTFTGVSVSCFSAFYKMKFGKFVEF